LQSKKIILGQPVGRDIALKKGIGPGGKSSTINISGEGVFIQK